MHSNFSFRLFPAAAIAVSKILTASCMDCSAMLIMRFPSSGSIKILDLGMFRHGVQTFLVYLHIIPLFLVIASPASALTGKVIHVTDGDTITILTDNFYDIRVRLYGIDCPERNQPFGNVAKRFVIDRVAGKVVDVTIYDWDRYGRAVGIVGNLNQELIEAGLAWVYPRYCRKKFCKKWHQIQADAEAEKRGLWKDQDCVPPWDWRRNRR